MNRHRPDEKIRRRAEEEPMMKQRRPDDVIRCSADADPMSKTIIGPMKLSVIGPMKHPSRARHRADEVVLVGFGSFHNIMKSSQPIFLKIHM